MTSAPSLFREGSDLDEILAELDAEYPGRVRVLDVSYDRVGGVMGFFAHRSVSVKYTLEDETSTGYADVFTPTVARTVPSVPSSDLDSASPLEALLSAAEAEDMITTGRTAAAANAATAPIVAAHPVPDSEIGTDAANVEFARMLLDMANAKAAARRAAREQADEITPEPETIEPAAEAVAPGAVNAQAVDAEPIVFRPAAPEPAAFPTLASLMSSAPAPAQEPTSLPPKTETRVFETPRFETPRSEAPQPPAPPAAPRPVETPRFETPAEPPAVTDWSSTAPTSRRTPGAHRAASEEAADRSEYSLRRQLVELGVPMNWIPERTSDAYWVIEQLASRVPSAEPTMVRPGDVLAVVGPARDAMRGAHELCRRLRLDPNSVLGIGCTEGSNDQPWTVATTVADARSAARAPLVVVIATDESGADFAASDDAWLRDMTRAVNADQVFLVADATRKAADTRSLMRTIGRTDALIVTGAARTTSPASVWELDVPIALLDGRASSRGAWVALLVDKLTALES